MTDTVQHYAEKAIPYLLAAVLALGGVIWADIRVQLNEASRLAASAAYASERALDKIDNGLALQQKDITSQGEKIGGLERRVDRLEERRGISWSPGDILDVGMQ